MEKNIRFRMGCFRQVILDLQDRLARMFDEKSVRPVCSPCNDNFWCTDLRMVASRTAHQMMVHGGINTFPFYRVPSNEIRRIGVADVIHEMEQDLEDLRLET